MTQVAPQLADDTNNWANSFRVNGMLKPNLMFRAATDANYVMSEYMNLPAYGGQSTLANAIMNIISPGQRTPGILNWSVTESVNNMTQTASLDVLDALPISTRSTTITGFDVGSPAGGNYATSTITPITSLPARWCSTTIRYTYCQDANGVSQILVGDRKISSFQDPALAGNQYVQSFQEENLQFRVMEPEVIKVTDLSQFPDPSVPTSANDTSGGDSFNEWWNINDSGIGAYYILVGEEIMRVTKIDRTNNFLYIIPGGRGVAGNITTHAIGDTVTLLGYRPFTGNWTAFGYLMPQDFRTFQSPFRTGSCFTSWEGYGVPGQYNGLGAQGLSQTFNRANNMCFTGYWFVQSPQASLDDSGVPKVTITFQSAAYVLNEQQINVDTVQRSANNLGAWADAVFDEVGYTRQIPGSWLDYSKWDPSLPGAYPLGISTEYGQNKAFFDHMADTTMGSTCYECQQEYLAYIAQHEGGVATGSLAETRSVGKHIYKESIQVYNNGGKFNAGPLRTYGKLMTAMAIGAWDNPLVGNALGTRWTKMPNQLFANMLNWTNGRVWNGQKGFTFQSETTDFDFSNQTTDDNQVYGCRVPLKCAFQATYDQQPWSQPCLDLAGLNRMTFQFSREGYPIFIPVSNNLRGLNSPSLNAQLGTSVPFGWFVDKNGNDTCDGDVGHGNWHLAYGASIDQYTHTIDPSSIYTLVYVSCQTAFGDEVQFTIPAAGTGIAPSGVTNQRTNEALVWYSSKVGNKEGLQMTAGVQQTDSVTMDNVLLGLDWDTNPASWGLTLARTPGGALAVDAQPPCPDPSPYQLYQGSDAAMRQTALVKQVQQLINFMIERRYIGPPLVDSAGHITYTEQMTVDGVYDQRVTSGVIGLQQFLAQANNGVNSSSWPNIFKKTGPNQYKFVAPNPASPGNYQSYYYTDNVGQYGEATYQAFKVWLTDNAEYIMTDVWWYVQNGLPWEQYVAAIVGFPIPETQDASDNNTWIVDQTALASSALDWEKQYFQDAINYGNSVVDESINQATQKVIQTNLADPRIQFGDIIWAEVPGYMSNANRFGSSHKQFLNGIYVTDITRTMDLQNSSYTATYQGYRYMGNFENNIMNNPSNYCSTLNNDETYSEI